MAKEVALARLKIAVDIIADVDRRSLFREEAEELNELEDCLLALAGRLSDPSRDGDYVSGRKQAVELLN